MAADSSKPRVLVLGGTGFIGRNFVHYLVTNDLAGTGMLASGETVVDLAAKHALEKPVNKRLAVPYSDFKVLTNMYGKKLWQTELERYPENKLYKIQLKVDDPIPSHGTGGGQGPPTDGMDEPKALVFSSPGVEFKHANLISQTSVEGAFASDQGRFDYVVNFAAETKYGQSEPVYHEGIVRLSENCARAAACSGVKMYVELSSGQMLSSDKKPVTEESKSEPWTNMAKHKLKVEQLLGNFPDLTYTILRPAIVYGIGDRQGLTPRLLIGAIYRYTKEKMKLLWTKDLHMNTVHVVDVCAAVWHLFTHGHRGQLYQLADKGNTTQGLISQLVSQLFDIDYDFVGSILSTMAKVNMSAVVEDINDKHMGPWADACQQDNIVNTPLTPFIDQELLYNKHLHMDGTKIEQTGFHYNYPELQLSSLRQILDDYVHMELFPKSLLTGEMPSNSHHDDNEDSQ